MKCHGCTKILSKELANISNFCSTVCRKQCLPKCPICHGPIRKVLRHPRTYCSDECRKLAYWLREVATKRMNIDVNSQPQVVFNIPPSGVIRGTR